MDDKTNKGFKRYARSMFNVSRWVGVDEIRRSFRSLKSTARSLWRIDQPEFEESFEEAIARLELEEGTLQQRKRFCLWVALLYFFLGLGMMIYGVHLFTKANDMLSSLVCFPLAIMLMTFAFKYHFWYTQIKYQRLGMGFRQWLLAFLTGVVR